MAQLTWHPHPDVWVLVAALGLGYVWMIHRVGPRYVHPIERPASRGQIGLFLLGLGVLWVSAEWPVHDLAEQLYAVHMVQHILMAFVVPPLLLLGTPGWMLRALLRPLTLMRAARFLTRPLVALVAFNAVIALIHWPAVVELMVTSELVHVATHGAVLGTGLLLWMPVLSPLMELPRLSYPGQMLYLFLQSLVPTVPASFMTFADGLLYRVYAQTTLVWGIDPLTDQRTAGLIMKIGGGLILWAVIAVLFARWFQLEDREGVDVMGWRGVEGSLNRAARQTEHRTEVGNR